MPERNERPGNNAESPTVHLGETGPLPLDVAADERDLHPIPEANRYVDAGEIGRGGMGRVNNVRDTRLQRAVAMKSLDPSMAGDRRLVARFLEEAQIQSQLDHPNVAPLHDVGIDTNGVAFFTMKLVRGTSLADWLRAPNRPPGSAERLGEGIEVFIKVCDAVAFAHSRGVLHRDLKPANIMLGAFGEVYVMDWGLATATGDAVVVSTGEEGPDQENVIAGTPSYMSPEAARGETYDERSDVFGLGAILYVIVTGQGVYGPLPTLHTVMAARKGAVVPPESAIGQLPISKRLVRIVEKAVNPDREGRYPTVVALRSDLQEFLRGGLNMPRRTFAPGTRIIEQGDPGREAYIIVEGTCVAYKTVDGQRRVLREMGPGEVFGETAVLSDSPRTASVDARDAVTLLVIDRATLEDGLGLDTWLGKLVKALAVRFRDLDALRQ